MDNPEVTSYAMELAAFCLVIGVLALNMLNSISGDLFGIDKFIANKPWTCIKCEDSVFVHYQRYFRIIVVSLLVMCPITLFVWAGTLFYVRIDNSEHIIVPVAVLMIGCFVIFFSLGIFYVKWKNYRLSYLSLGYFIVGGGCLLTYELCGNFLDVEKRSFFGISAVFLSYNCVVVMFVIFLNTWKNAVNFLDVLADKLQLKTETSTVDLEQDFTRQVAEQESNKAYQITKEELDHFYTIKEEDSSLLSGGAIRQFGALQLSTKVTISVALYVFSVCILVGYAFIIYNCTDEYRLGFVIFIAIVTTDCVLYCFYYVGLSQSVLQLSFLAIMIRLCFFGFGGDYWYYGYCLLYGILGIIVCANIAAKYFPLIGVTLADAERSAGGNYMKDLMNTPEFVVLFATAAFAIITIALDASNPNGVPLPSLHSSTKEYPFWSMALLALGVVALSYLLMAIVRILIRKKERIVDDVQIYFFATFFDVFWIHVYLCYGLLIIAGFVAYAMSDDPTFLILACYVPAIVILLIYIYIHYNANDYHILKDIKAENERRERLKKLNNRKLTSLMLSQKDLGSSVRIAPPPAPSSNKDDEEEKKADDNDHASEDSSSKRPVIMITGSPPPAAKKELSVVSREITAKRELSAVATGNQVAKGALELALAETEATDQLEDWTLQYNPFTAFFAGKLYWQDYRIIFGIAGILVLILVTAITLQGNNRYDSSWYGVTLSFIILDTFLIAAPIYRHLRTDIRFGIGQIVWIVVGLAAHIAYGIGYFSHREEGNMDTHNNFYWVSFYVIFVPAFVALTSGLYKWYLMKWKINPYTIVMTCVLVGLMVVFTIMLWVRYGWLAGVITLVVDSILAYGAVLTYFYAANNYYLSFGFRLTNIILICLGACAVMICSWAISDFEPFVGLSITYCIIDFGAMIYFLVRLMSACGSFLTEPTFLSPYVFPVYSYNANRQTSIPYNFTIIGLYLTLLAALFWGILLSVYAYPMYYGVSVCCLVVVIIDFLSLFLITYTSIKLQECKEYITSEALNTGWLRAKKKYVESQNAINLGELISYSELQDVHKIVKNKEGNGGVQQLRLSSKQILNINVEALTEKQQYDLLHEVEDEIKERYIDETKLMIDFQLLVMLSAINAKINVQTKTVNFLKAKEMKLRAYGIDIKYRAIIDPSLRHNLIKAQVAQLTPEQRVKYNELFREFEDELDEQKKKNAERDKASQAAEDVRMKKLQELEEAKKRQKARVVNQDNLPIDEMLDSPKKYEKILAQFRLDGKPYSDKQFPPEEKSLGAAVKSMATGWRRAGDDMILYDKTICAMDVKQGALGDCYYLSAISVLGENFVKRCLVTKPEDVKCGAFCVKFFKSGEEEEYVIIDNNFPTSNDDWAFVKSENGKELWPMILEKAYAKLYGSYENIEAGKVQYALSDLTGGAPQQFKLDTEAENLDVFWTKVFNYYKAGYLMGAGSPEHEMGDRAQTPDGIIQGHAYSVLELNEFENERLLRLRNPHGSRGAEWSGDWSDGCPKWTEAAKAKLNYVNAEDGVFWMNLGDFCAQYANLYICRIFDEKWLFKSFEVFLSIRNQ